MTEQTLYNVIKYMSYSMCLVGSATVASSVFCKLNQPASKVFNRLVANTQQPRLAEFPDQERITKMMNL